MHEEQTAGKDSIEGLTYIGGACTSIDSYSIIHLRRNDSTFYHGKVLAHEILHSLGAHHDEDTGCSGGFLMERESCITCRENDVKISSCTVSSVYNMFKKAKNGCFNIPKNYVPCDNGLIALKNDDQNVDDTCMQALSILNSGNDNLDPIMSSLNYNSQNKKLTDEIYKDDDLEIDVLPQFDSDKNENNDFDTDRTKKIIHHSDSKNISNISAKANRIPEKDILAIDESQNNLKNNLKNSTINNASNETEEDKIQQKDDDSINKQNFFDLKNKDNCLEIEANAINGKKEGLNENLHLSKSTRSVLNQSKQEKSSLALLNDNPQNIKNKNNNSNNKNCNIINNNNINNNDKESNAKNGKQEHPKKGIFSNLFNLMNLNNSKFLENDDFESTCLPENTFNITSSFFQSKSKLDNQEDINECPQGFMMNGVCQTRSLYCQRAGYTYSKSCPDAKQCKLVCLKDDNTCSIMGAFNDYFSKMLATPITLPDNMPCELNGFMGFCEDGECVPIKGYAYVYSIVFVLLVCAIVIAFFLIFN
ncbi:hypothetical protein EDEG_01309 [Edhazardia aedis USNM 41457]|uniref:Peptidase M12B domain-containing protein n=1 Tax=Edhazardia aedis (strain USNM 41457) TaxID=1003232 RepID=J9DAA1_EDHAE|nr:hypothetical protein EDEG_01309 [Edhazardia aedis USNM 41457]|eukprot:EJW04439.1 hypothetical protein EDEG_01309 [Edhazardia aedis USNM 41457]